MKLILLICLLLPFTSYAKSLSCSQNGTDVYYVNGVLTNADKNKIDKDAIKRLFRAKENQLDSGPLILGRSPVNFIGVFNPSFGLINDVAELFSEAYYIKTGSNSNARAIYNAVKNTPDTTAADQAKYDPNGYFAKLNSFGFGANINYASLKYLAEESETVAQARSLATVDQLLNEGNIVSHNIATYLKDSQDANHKILFVAHSQGNAVLEAGLKEITQNRPAQDDYVKKYMGVYHVASPVPPLVSPYKSRNIRVFQDTLIAAASVLPGYPVSVGPITHFITSTVGSADLSGHLFADTYISGNVFARPINSYDTPISMSENFVSTLSDLATDLENNCPADIRICANDTGFGSIYTFSFTDTLSGSLLFSGSLKSGYSFGNNIKVDCECHSYQVPANKNITIKLTSTNQNPQGAGIPIMPADDFVGELDNNNLNVLNLQTYFYHSDDNLFSPYFKPSIGVSPNNTPSPNCNYIDK